MSGDNPFEMSSDSYGDRSGADYDSTGVEVSARTIQLLTETRPWVSLIGILSWIGTVFMGIATVFLVGGAALSGQMSMLFMSLVYVLITVVYGIVAKSLTTYASKISSLVATERLVDLEEALSSQKTFWKTVGIITVIYLIFLVLGLIGMFAFGALLGGAF